MAGSGTSDRDYYDRYYRDYALQNPPAKLEFYRDLVESSVGSGGRRRILEIGCAFGDFLSVLGAGWERCGLDVNRYAIEAARGRLPDAMLSVSSGADMPFDGVFTVIAAFDVVEHIEDIDSLAAAVRSKLAPGGIFVFVVPVYDGVTGGVVRILDRDTTHVHKKSRRFWLDWAGRYLRVERWMGVCRFLFPNGYYLHRPTTAFRRFAPAIAVVASWGG